MTTNNHPAHGPVSLDRLYQISEILSKAAAQSDGGNLGYAMADAVKVIAGAIAAFGAEPVAWRYRYVHTPKTEEHGSPFTTEWKLCDREDECNPSDCFERQPLYTNHPSYVFVPAELTREEYRRRFMMEDNFDDTYRGGWSACRDAMLQSGNSPVTPDDVRRMDWLVSKTVNVREPMVYGSHSLFWSQTITDEEDDYHATKLREQIDEAMAAERAAAPQQEVKSALEHGMQRYAGAMQKLSEGDK
ncbi:hypothetical protein NNQ81_001973 [Salmonella enterica]|nr:hypothetical protein [Salmonella enterica]